MTDPGPMTLGASESGCKSERDPGCCSAAALCESAESAKASNNITRQSKELIVPLCPAMVQPHLEYHAEVWAPRFEKDCQGP